MVLFQRCPDKGKAKRPSPNNNARNLIILAVLVIVVVIGVLILGTNLGWYGWLFGFGEWWPILLIAGGLALILKNRDGTDPGTN